VLGQRTVGVESGGEPGLLEQAGELFPGCRHGAPLSLPAFNDALEADLYILRDRLTGTPSETAEGKR